MQEPSPVPRRRSGQPAADRAHQGGARQAGEGRDSSADDLRKVEDLEIEKIVHKQASIGLKLATDGEFRRSWWHFDFLAKSDRLRDVHPDDGIQFAGVPGAARASASSASSISRPTIRCWSISVPEEAGRHAPMSMPKMTIPSPAVLHFRGGRKSISKTVYPDIDAFYRGSRQDLPQGGEGVLRRRLPLSAVRRHRVGLSLLAGGDEEGPRARRRRRRPAGDLCAHHQLRDRRAAGRHDDHDACLPRQFPLDLDLVRRLRAGRRDHAGRHQLRRLFPRIRLRPRRRLRAAALPAEGQQDRGGRPHHLEERRRWRRRTTSSGGSTRPRNSRRSSSSRCRRNAASPRPRRATSSPRTSSGQSCKLAVEIANEVWGK